MVQMSPTLGTGQCVNFHHITFWVSNAKQSASFFVAFFGFEPLAHKSLETGSRDFASHVVRQGDIVLVFVSPLTTDNTEFGNSLKLHGDFVKDIAFCVDDLEHVFSCAVQNGATVVRPIWSEEDICGKVRFATVASSADMTHTLVELNGYSGIFLPGYREPSIRLPDTSSLLPINLQFIDHCVTTRYENSIDDSCDWYQKNLSFHRFWSVDDVAVKTTKSSLRFLVVANDSETIKMTILEPAAGAAKSQVQEFHDFNGGPGTQHIALHTDDIITTVKNLRKRGVDFLDVPDSYYDILRDKLSSVEFKVHEDLDEIAGEKILLDHDENGYLLQIFTKPLQDRPTLFLEIIQRHNYSGFGAGNFKTLFLAVEREQAKRGNL